MQPFEETTARAFHMLDDLQSQDVVLKRLKRIKQHVDQREKRAQNNPFQKTFMEKIREMAGLESHQQLIKARLHWFAGSDWRREELEQAIDKKVKLSNTQTSVDGNRNFDYSVDTLDPSSLGYSTDGVDDEYLQMYRDTQSVGHENNHADVDLFNSGRHAATKSAESSQNQKKHKTTTDLFLSVQSYVLEKENQPATENCARLNTDKIDTTELNTDAIDVTEIDEVESVATVCDTAESDSNDSVATVCDTAESDSSDTVTESAKTAAQSTKSAGTIDSARAKKTKKNLSRKNRAR